MDKTQTDNEVTLITQIDTSAVRRNQAYNALRQDTSGVDLTGAVMGDVDELRMSTVQEFEDDLGRDLKVRANVQAFNLHSEREEMGETGQNFIDAARMARQPTERQDGFDQSDSELDSEARNFQSAPINMKSAYQGNRALQERHQAFQAELVRKGLRHEYMETDDQAREQSVCSDDEEVNNYRSEVWGDGTTKAVQAHYQSLRTRSHRLVSEDFTAE